ncbi:MAG: ATP-binding protein [Dehalococcoidia bacterium]
MRRDLFFGRERELGLLREALGAALDGHTRVVMLAGEPGIGKTRVAEELERHARVGGALVLWGRSRETAGAPPYWPWVQSTRALIASAEPDVLRALLGADGTG